MRQIIHIAVVWIGVSAAALCAVAQSEPSRTEIIGKGFFCAVEPDGLVVAEDTVSGVVSQISTPPAIR